MLEGIYTWIRSLAGYFLFVTVLEQLLPGKKYGKYVRLFSGMVLILLVVQPLTDKAQMEAKIAQDYETLLFQYEAGDLKKEILGVEHERFRQMIQQYEEAVAGDIRSMAEDSGVNVQDCHVSICEDQEKEQFGTVTEVRLSVYADSQADHSGAAAVQIEPVKPAAVDITGERETKKQKIEDDTVKRNDQEAAAVGTGNLALVLSLRKKIAAYYNLEEAYVEIQIVEGKR